MRDTRPLLEQIPFPPVSRRHVDTLQVNLGYHCNQSCVHCHVAAGPDRTEEMDEATVAGVIAFLRARRVPTLDLTGGAPELHPRFRDIVRAARAEGMEVIDRCNLTILLERGQEDLAEFLAAQRVTVTASMPCYLRDNVDRQRGKGVYARSIAGLKRLNALGYGRAGGGLTLNLVYNPGGPSLPPPQATLEADYRRELGDRHGIVFNRLFTLANMPIRRFGAALIAKGAFDDYLALLRMNHCDANLDGVMCRTTLSVDYRGIVHDCDFNQMLDLPVMRDGAPLHVAALLPEDGEGGAIRVGGHCYGCTAGQGSSCTGALAQAAE
jgi:radical SAM/Cys-rich protein